MIAIILLAFIAIWFWRMRLMITHPEKYERFHHVEEQVARFLVASSNRIAAGIKNAVGAGMGIVGRMLKRT